MLKAGIGPGLVKNSNNRVSDGPFGFVLLQKNLMGYQDGHLDTDDMCNPSGRGKKWFKRKDERMSTTNVHAPGRRVDIGGRKLWVEEEGNGKPLILLPGGAVSHLTFHPAFSSLSDKYSVIYYDYYGRGKSDRPSSYKDITFQQDVEDLELLRRALGFGKMYVYGLSYGGLVAQGYALQYGSHVKRLVLANTLHSPEMWQKNHENINAEIQNQYPERWDTIMNLRQKGIRSNHPDMMEAFIVATKIVRMYNPDNMSGILKEPDSYNYDLYWEFVGTDIDFFISHEVPKIPDFRPHLKTLTMPVLILAGRHDRALYPKYQMEFKHYCPQAEFVMMERSGSFIHIEEPERLFSLLEDFLK